MTQIENLPNGNIRVKVPLTFNVISNRKRAINLDTNLTKESTEDVAPLVLHLARAFRWRKLIDEGKFKNTLELAEAVKLDRAYIDRTLRLTFLSPEIIHAVITNTAPAKVNLRTFRSAFPIDWEEQNRCLRCNEIFLADML